MYISGFQFCSEIVWLVTGFLITFSLWTWGSTVETLHPLYFILFSVPTAISGGGVLLNLAAYCYICDVSSTDDRGAR